MSVHLAGLKEETLAQAAGLWYEGWHQAHAAIVPETLTRLRTHDDFVRRMRELAAQTTVALSGDDVLGFVIVVKDELYQMFVDKRAQGTGVAGVLMQHALDQIRANGAAKGWLSCSIGNARAAAFYAKSGWTNVGEEMVDVDTSEGAFELAVWRFEKPL